MRVNGTRVVNVGRLWGREPALILGAVNALLALAVGFGLAVTAAQVGLINAAVAAVLAVVVRSRVTPSGGGKRER